MGVAIAEAKAAAEQAAAEDRARLEAETRQFANKAEREMRESGARQGQGTHPEDVNLEEEPVCACGYVFLDSTARCPKCGKGRPAPRSKTEQKSPAKPGRNNKTLPPGGNKPRCCEVQ